MDAINDGVPVAFFVTVLFPFIGLRGIKLPGGRLLKIGYWPWWKHELGWNLVAFDVVLAAALLPGILHRLFGMNPASLVFIWIDTACVWLIPVTIVWRAVAIWHAQRIKGRGPADDSA